MNNCKLIAKSVMICKFSGLLIVIFAYIALLMFFIMLIMLLNIFQCNYNISIK